MFELFKLVGRVMVDSSGANQALEGTDKKAQGATGNLGGYMDKLQGWAKAAGTAIGASAIVKGIQQVWDISSQVAEIGDNIDKASQKFMLSREAYQEWAFVAERSGFDIETLGNSVFNLSKKVGEGKDDILAVLEEIGVSVADAMTATPEELFDMVITGLQGVDEGSRRAYLADKLFGDAAKNLNPLLNTSAEETKKLKDEVHALGGVMSDQLVDQSAKFQDSQTNLQTAWDGVENHLAEKTLPGMTQIIDGLTQMLTGDFAGGLTTAADGVASYLSGILISFSDFASKIRAEIESAFDLDLSPILDNPIFNPFSISGAEERNKKFNDEMERWKSDVEADGGALPATRGYFSGAFDNWISWRNKTFGMGGYTDRSGKFENGLDFVPRDDYPARLHYGEQVLTKQEADDYRAGKASGGNITINITTTQQSPAQTAAAVASALTRARWAM